MGLTIYAEPHITHLYSIGILLGYSLAFMECQNYYGQKNA